MLVSIDHRFALLAPDHHRDDFFGKEAGLLSRSSTLLAAQREGVLIGATYLPLIGDVVSSLRHGIHAIPFLHLRIDEAPANGDRKSVVEGKSVSVRVALGGGRVIKKKNQQKHTPTCHT